MTSPFASSPGLRAAKQVLVVDDDRTTTHLLAARLKSHGLAVTAAYDAMQAVMHARREVPDVILLDLNMPGGSGLDVLRRLRAMNGTALTPVLIVSGNLDAAARQTATELGAEAFLAKPVDFAELFRALDRVLGVAEPPVIARALARPRLVVAR